MHVVPRKMLFYLVLGAGSNYVFAVGETVHPQWAAEAGRWVQSVIDEIRGSHSWGIRCCTSSDRPSPTIAITELATLWQTRLTIENFYALDCWRDEMRLAKAEQFNAISAEIGRAGCSDLAVAFADARDDAGDGLFCVFQVQFGWPCRSLSSYDWIAISRDSPNPLERSRHSLDIGPIFGLNDARVPIMPIAAGFGFNSIFWGTVGGAGVFATRRGMFAFRRWRRPLCCAHCGYCLAGLATARCPECGNDSVQSPPSVANHTNA